MAKIFEVWVRENNGDRVPLGFSSSDGLERGLRGWAERYACERPHQPETVPAFFACLKQLHAKEPEEDNPNLKKARLSLQGMEIAANDHRSMLTAALHLATALGRPVQVSLRDEGTGVRQPTRRDRSVVGERPETKQIPVPA